MYETEDALIGEAQNGDQRAAQRLVAAYVPLIKATARKLGAPVEDALGEGTIALYAALRAYDPARNRPFAAYARTVVRRSLAAWIAEERAQQMEAGRSLDEPCPDSDVETRHDIIADHGAVNPEKQAAQRSTIRAALSRLTTGERSVFLRHVLCERSLAELGARRGVTRAAASKAYVGAIRRMAT